MASSIDQRIVDMRFNNADFENGIKDSLSSIDNLKKGLADMDGLSTGLDAAADSADKAGSSFSVLEEIAIGALRKIGEAAVDFGIDLAKSVTIDPIIAGFSQYEEKIGSMKAIMNATRMSAAEVGEALAGIIFYADETSYSFNDMSTAIRLFTSSGIEIEDAVQEIMGLGSAAALAGVPLSKMESVFSAVSKSIGQGSVRIKEWDTLSLAGLTTSMEFKQILLDTAVSMGTLTKAGEGYIAQYMDPVSGKIKEMNVSLVDMRTALKSGYLSKAVLESTLAQFGDFANDVYLLTEEFADNSEELLTKYGKTMNDVFAGVGASQAQAAEMTRLMTEENYSFDKAMLQVMNSSLLAAQAMNILSDGTQTFGERGMRAAQEARTLTETIQSVTSAVASRWRDTWELIIGDVDEATELFGTLVEVLWDLFVVSGENRNAILQLWRGVDEGDLDGRTVLIEALANMGNSLLAVIEAIKEAWQNIFPPMTGERLLELTVRFRDFTAQLIPSERTLENITRTFQGLFAVLDIAGQVLGFIGGIFGKIIGAIFPMTGAVLELTGGIGDFVVGLRDWIKESEIFGKALEVIGGIIDKVKVGVVLGLAFMLDRMADLLDFLAPFVDAIETSTSSIAKNIINGLTNGLSEGIPGCINAIINVAKAIFETIKSFFGIQSPSLIMIAIGGFIIAGLIKGLLSGEGELNSAAGRIGKALLVGLEAAIKTIDLLIQGLSWIFLTGAEVIKWCIDQIGGYFSQFGGIDLGPLKIISDETKELFKPFEAIANVAKKVFNGIVIILTTIGDAIKTGLNALGIKDLETLIQWVFSGGILVLLNQLINFLQPLSETFGGFSKLMDGLGGALEGFTKRLKAEALFTIAKALAVLAASLLVLSFLPFDKMMQGIVAISALTGILAILSKLGGTFNMVKMGAGMSMLGLGLLELAGAMAILSLLSWESIGKGIAVLASLMAVIGVLGVLGSTNLLKLAAGLVLIGTGLTLMIVPLLALALIPFDWIMSGLQSMAAILLVLAGVSILTKSGILVELGASLTLFAVGLTLLIIPLTALGLIPFDIIGQGLLAMATALGILAIASHTVDSNTLIRLGAGLLIVSAALVVLGAAFIVIGFLSWDSLAKGLITLAAALVALVVASNLMGSGGNMAKISVVLIALAGTLAIIAAAFFIMSALGIDDMLSTALSMSVLLVAIGAFLVVMEKIGPNLSRSLGVIATLALFATALTLLTAPFIALSLFDVDNTIEMMVSLSGLLVAIGAFLIAMDKLGPSLSSGISAIGMLALFAIALTLLTAPFIALKLFDVTNTLETMTALSGLLIIIGAFIAIIGNIPIIAGLTAVGNLAIFVIGLTALLTILGALMQIPGFAWLIDEGIDLLVKMGYGLGEFVGSIIGGFLGGISNGFPQIAENLSLFIDNLKPFLDGVKDVDASVMSGIESLAKAVLVLTAASLIDGIASFLGFGTTSFIDFGKSLAEFGPYFVQYYESIKSIDGDVIQASANAALSLAEFAKKLPAKGGILQDWIGTKDLSTFALELVDFGPALVRYAESVTGLDANAVTGSANAALTLANLANKLPTKGGILQDWIGTKDLSTFALELVDFGPALMLYSKSVTGLDANAVTGSANAALTLANLANKLPAKGGILQDWIGTKDLSNFAWELANFGPALMLYSKSVTGLDANAVTGSANAALTLANLVNNLPAKGGFIQEWMGTKDLSNFAWELVDFGPAMRVYGNSIAGIDSNAVSASANAALALANLVNNLPAKGGFIQEWVGTKDLSNFAKELADFGPAMKIYGDSVAGINPSAVEASANAALSLAKLAENLPTESGISTWMGKAKDLSTFAKELVDFGPAMRVYGDSVAGINPSAVEASTNAALSLAKLTTNLPSDSGSSNWSGKGKDLSTFANELINFGPAIKTYADSVVGINVNNVEASANAALALANLANNLGSSGDLSTWFGKAKDLSTFAKELADFGPAIKAYADSVVGINSNNVEASANAALALANLANNLGAESGISTWFGKAKDLSTFAKELLNFGPAIKAYADSVTGIDAISISSSANAAAVLANMATTLPPNGFASWLTGTSTLSDFGKELSKFGPYMKAYGDSVNGINNTNIIASAASAQILVEMANNLPPSSGWFSNVQTLADFGDNLKTFGGRLAEYATNIRSINTSDLKSSSESVALLVEMAKGISTLDTSKMVTFGKDLKTMGNNGINEFIAAFTNSETQVKNAVGALIGHASSKLPDLTPKFTQAGQDGITALIAGFDSKRKDLENAVTMLGQETILQTFRNAVGWHSPWDPMIEAGADGITGLLVGFESESDALKSGTAQIGEDSVDSLKTGISGAFEGASGTFRNMAASLRDSLIPKDMQEIGTSAVQELVTGLTEGSSEVNIAGQELGASAMIGAAEGINTNSEIATRAAKDASDKIAKEMADARKKQFEEEKKDILHRRALNQLTLYSEYEEWQAIQAKYTKGTDERLRTESEMVDMLIAYRQMGAISTEEELAAWEYANNQYIEDIDVRRRVELELYKTRQVLAKETFDVEIKGIHERSVANEISRNRELEEYAAMQAQYAKNSEEYIRLEKEIDRVRNEIFEDDIKRIQERSAANEISLRRELTEYAVLQLQYQKDSEEYIRLENEKNRVRKALFEEEKKDIEHRRALNQLGLREELAEWLWVQSRYAQGSDERKNAEAEMINAIVAYRQTDGASLMEELAAWEWVQTRYIEGSDERRRVELELQDVRKRIVDEQIRLTKEMDRIEEEYNKSVENRAKQIAGYFGLFDEVKDSEAVSGKTLMANLSDQVRALEKWANDLATLSKRGVDEGLVEELRQMGPSAQSEITALVKMTDKELSSYEKLWKDKNELARKQAISELQTLRKETTEEIAGIKKELEALTITDVSGLTTATQTAIDSFLAGFALPDLTGAAAALQENIVEAVQSTAPDYNILGTSYGIEFINGWRSVTADAKASGQEVTKNTEIGLLSNQDIYGQVGTKYGTDFTNALSNTQIAGQTSGKNVTNKAEEGLKSNKDVYGQTGTKYGKDFSSALDSTKKDAEASGKAVTGSGVNGIRSLISEYLRAGLDSVQGFINGLKNGQWSAYDAGVGLGQSALDGIRAALDTHSPSRETEEIGVYSGVGFVNGIQSMFKRITMSTDEMGSIAIDSLKEAINEITNLFYEEIDLTPSITPVLDLSNVQNGMESLRAMLSGTENVVTPITNNARRISTQMAARNEVSSTAEDTALKEGATFNFEQNNYSPKALTRLEIYRETKNQFAQFKTLVEEGV